MIKDTAFSRINQNQPDPDAHNYNDHFEALKPFNRAFRAHIESVLDWYDFVSLVKKNVVRVGGNESTVVGISCLGSDGREENAACSPIDILAIVVDSGLDNTLAFGIGTAVKEEFKNQYACPLIGEIEVKFVEQPLWMHEGNPKKIWPDRVTDAIQVNPLDRDLVGFSRQTLAEQLQFDEAQVGKKVMDKVSERIKSYTGICKKGTQTAQQQLITHFSLEDGVAYFDDSLSRNKIGPASFKQNALRLVQSCVNKVIFGSLIKSTQDQSKAIALALPTNTVDRLEFLKGEGIVSGEFNAQQQVRLADNYKYFLWQYHRSEHRYMASQETSIPFDKKEVANRMQDLVEDGRKLAVSLSTPVSFSIKEVPWWSQNKSK